MRLDTLKQGDVVVYGTRNDLRHGLRGEDVIVLATGYFTAAMGPCGPMVRPYTPTSKRERKRAVVAARVERYDHLRDGRITAWVPRIVSATNLMDPREYKAKNDVLRKQKRDLQRWNAELQRLQSTLAPKIVELMREHIMPSDIKWRSSSMQPEVRILAEQLVTRIGDQLEPMLVELREHEKKDPRRC